MLYIGLLLGILIGKFIFPILEAISGYIIAVFNLKYYKTHRLSSFESVCTEVEAEQILGQKINNNGYPVGFYNEGKGE